MKPLVVGLGSVDRGDDAVGILVARKVAQRLSDVDDSVADVLETTDPSRLVDVGSGRTLMVVVDAVLSDDDPGTVRIIEVGEGSLPFTSTASTHDLALSDVLELARVLDKMPARVVVVGIEMDSVGHGGGLSVRVDEALPFAVEAVLQLLG